MSRRDARCQALLCLAMWITLGGCMPVPVSGLRPIDPAARTPGLFEEPKGFAFASFVEVDSLQPTLRWESFPRPQDRKADKEALLSRISDVTYDLRIWRVDSTTRGAFPAEMVYSRQGLRLGLTEPYHRVEHLLAPSTMYLWSVRVRFKLDGHTRVSEWGTYSGGRQLRRIPNPFYYRFKTPSQ